MNVFYFVGPAHHKEHLAFIHDVLGGTFVETGKSVGNTIDDIALYNNPDCLWFFADLYENLIPAVKGKIIFVPHGLGFKPYLTGNQLRVRMLRENVHSIWSTGFLEEIKYAHERIPSDKIVRIGFTPLFGIPNIPIENDTAFISVGWHQELLGWENMYSLLESFPVGMKGYVSAHPNMPLEIRTRFIDLCCRRGNLQFMDTEEQMLETFARCGCAIGGLSSVLTPFYFLGKPVILIKDRNRFPFFQWQRLRFKVHSPLFHRIVSESTRLLGDRPLTKEGLQRAKAAPSGKQIFYPTNWDRDATIQLIRKAYSNISLN